MIFEDYETTLRDVLNSPIEVAIWRINDIQVMFQAVLQWGSAQKFDHKPILDFCCLELYDRLVALNPRYKISLRPIDELDIKPRYQSFTFNINRVLVVNYVVRHSDIVSYRLCEEKEND